MEALLFHRGVLLVPALVWAQDTANFRGAGCKIIPIEGWAPLALRHLSLP